MEIHKYFSTLLDFFFNNFYVVRECCLIKGLYTFYKIADQFCLVVPQSCILNKPTHHSFRKHTPIASPKLKEITQLIVKQTPYTL